VKKQKQKTKNKKNPKNIFWLFAPDHANSLLKFSEPVPVRGALTSSHQLVKGLHTFFFHQLHTK
jgi:2,3-bisphosphoglycerate-independent phosphoglycerate mutase